MPRPLPLLDSTGLHWATLGCMHCAVLNCTGQHCAQQVVQVVQMVRVVRMISLDDMHSYGLNYQIIMKS